MLILSPSPVILSGAKNLVLSLRVNSAKNLFSRIGETLHGVYPEWNRRVQGDKH